MTEFTATGQRFEARLHRMADLILRQHFALVDEGIGPQSGSLDDSEILRDAVKLVGHMYNAHALWDSHLLTDAEHPGSKECQRCTSLRRSRKLRADG